ncbi:sensor histidine kinase [Peptococcus simiae]|uniref:sensor histidine kinase n=1 Tax=Peptococcus simiae TaxID=1643805 RepID=UPI0039807390
MKSRLFKTLCLTILITLLLNTVISIFGYYTFYSRQQGDALMNETLALAQGLSGRDDKVSYLASFEPVRQKGLRITLVEGDGRVSYDNQSDAASMANHKERPEISTALSLGRAADQRVSKTLGVETHYTAARVPGTDQVLRLARDSSTMFGVFLRMLPAIFVMVLGLFLLSMIASRSLTKWFLRPIEEAADDLTHGQLPESYDELEPFFREIITQRETIEDHLETLRSERATINDIIENMEEGLVLLDKDHQVLAVNASAINFFTPYVMPTVGEHMIALSRQPELLEAVELAEKGHSSSNLLKHGSVIGRFFVNPVYRDDAIVGAIILLLDVTDQVSAQQAREEFSANVSHELKTPLTSISGFAEMLANDMVKSEEDRRHFAQHIYTEAGRLLELIDHIMRLSAIEQGELDGDNRVNIQDVINQVMDRFDRIAEKNEVRLSAMETKAAVFGNEVLLADMLGNLVDNAIKYNIPGGYVHISVMEEGDEVLISVSDNGAGIPKDMQSRLFERFYRVDTSHSNKTASGSGLGLSIVKHIVQRHHGTIDVDSAPGRGTTITVHFLSADALGVPEDL